METNIRIQYMGVIRLLLGKREDIFSFPEPLTLGELIEGVGKVYGAEIREECKKQAFILHGHEDAAGQMVTYVKAFETVLQDGCTIKVISPITGG